MALTVEQVVGMAPDDSSVKAGRKLSAERHWPKLGRVGEALWGLCQGSGAKPYQARVDLSGPAWKCSCPSRKIPCKHSLGLMLLYAEKPGLFAAEKPCDFLAEWLADRQERAAQKEQKQAEKAGEVAADPEALARRQEAKTKRAASREDKVADGIAELALFVTDLARQGLASVAGKPYGFWDGMAARLVDAQAPGLARQIGRLGSASRSGEGWQQRLLRLAGRLHLACAAWPRINSLPKPLRADLRAFVGFSTPQEEVQTERGVPDDWYVFAQSVLNEDGVRFARTWYWGGNDQRAAVIHQYAYANQPLQLPHGPGTALRGELAFFPSVAPWRALLKEGAPAAQIPFARPPGLHSLDAMLAAFAGTLAENPWAESRAYLLDSVLPLHQGDHWQLQDTAGIALPLCVAGDDGWELLSLSGGQPLTVFGEWDGTRFLARAAIGEDDRLHCLTMPGKTDG